MEEGNLETGQHKKGQRDKSSKYITNSGLKKREKKCMKRIEFQLFVPLTIDLTTIYLHIALGIFRATCYGECYLTEEGSWWKLEYNLYSNESVL